MPPYRILSGIILTALIVITGCSPAQDGGQSPDYQEDVKTNNDLVKNLLFKIRDSEVIKSCFEHTNSMTYAVRELKYASDSFDERADSIVMGGDPRVAQTIYGQKQYVVQPYVADVNTFSEQIKNSCPAAAEIYRKTAELISGYPDTIRSLKGCSDDINAAIQMLNSETPDDWANYAKSLKYCQQSIYTAAMVEDIITHDEGCDIPAVKDDFGGCTDYEPPAVLYSKDRTPPARDNSALDIRRPVADSVGSGAAGPSLNGNRQEAPPQSAEIAQRIADPTLDHAPLPSSSSATNSASCRLVADTKKWMCRTSNGDWQEKLP